MKTEALALMLFAACTLTAFTVYFFCRVHTARKKPEPDSCVENDDEPR